MNLDDRRTIAGLRNGDEAAFRRFYDENYARIYRISLARTNGNEIAAEDLVRATFSSAIRSTRRLKCQASIFAWLCAICRKLIVEYRQQSARQESASVCMEDGECIPDVIGPTTASREVFVDVHPSLLGGQRKEANKRNRFR